MTTLGDTRVSAALATALSFRVDFADVPGSTMSAARYVINDAALLL